MKQMNTEKHESIQLTLWKMPKLTLKQRIARVNRLCVKSYLEILDYRCRVSDTGYAIFLDTPTEGCNLYVDRKTNQVSDDDRKLIGGVVDVACLIFEEDAKEI